MITNNSNPLKDLEERLRSNGTNVVSFFADDVVEIIDLYKNVLKELEWVIDDDWREGYCRFCEKWEHQGHDETCKMKNLLKSQ